LTASPYSPRGTDPQDTVKALGFGGTFVLVDHVPKKQIESSRYGVRVQSVVARDYTVSAFYYTYYPSVPSALSDGQIHRPTDPLFVTETVHDKKAWTVGLTNTFFLEPVDAIIRMQASYFAHEAGFVPKLNLGVPDPLNACNIDPRTGKGGCHIPYADYLRWEVGYDRFFFIRPLNPTNSFTFIGAIVGSYNLDETSKKDFTFAGQRKPGTLGTSASDFVTQKQVEAFAQITLQTDYMHGKLEPRLTYIQNRRGTWALAPQATYRWNDSLLFTFEYINIGGEYQQLGFFRDRSQVSFRATYQLN
jgi:hypothetical protein